MTYTIIARALRALFYPFKVIKEGKTAFALYAIVHGCLTLYVLKQAIRGTHLFLNQVVTDFPKTVGLAQHLIPFVATFCWLVLGPIIVTSAVVPVRQIWIKQKLVLIEVFELSIQLLRTFVLSIGAATRVAIISLLPAFGVLIIYKYYVNTIEASSLSTFYTFACIVVGAVSVIRSLPILLIPLITLCSRLDPYAAAYHAREILEKRILELTSVILATMCMRHLFHSSLEYFWGSVSFRNLEYVALGGDVVLFWYVITGLTIIVLNAVQEISDRQVAEAPAAVVGNDSQPKVTRVWVNS